MKRYLEIFADLSQKIQQKIYPADSLLPSENQLAKHYQVSRETIRKALTLLLEEGYIQKKQGKGSIVLSGKRVNFPITGLTSYKELQQSLNISGQTIVHCLKEISVDAKLEVQTGFSRNTKLWQVIRQREIDGEVIILDKDYLTQSIVPNLTKEIAADSIYAYLENTLNLTISYAQKEIVVEPVTEEDEKLMTLKSNDTHVVVIRSHVFLEDTQMFQYTESRHRLDRFRFVEFARRRSGR